MIDYKNLLDRFDAHEFDGSVAHNAATALAIQGGTDLALADRVAFDPRKDFWYLVERRFFVAFFATNWPEWPKGKDDDSFLQFALAVAKHLSRARTAGRISHEGWGYEKGLPALMAKVSEEIESLPSVQGWEQLPKKIDGESSPVRAIQRFAKDAGAAGFKGYEQKLRHNIRWFPFLGVDTATEVERRQRFFVCFAHAVMSTNAYRTAGAQYFGPIIHNTATTVFLDCLDAWRSGKSLRAAPLIALDNTDSNVAADRSHTNIVRELWGFLNLHREPFYNKRASEYVSMSGSTDPSDATRVLGEQTREYLAAHPADVQRAVVAFRRAIDSAKRHSDRPFAVARRSADADSPQTFDGRLLATIRDAGRNRLLNQPEIDQAMTMLHLALDASTYLASTETAAVVRGAEGELGPDFLRSAPRVWIYAPGTQASNWSKDREDGAASINWSVGDLSAFESEDAIRSELDDGEPGGDADHGARVCWQFVHDVKIGDPIIARSGRSKIVGIGIVNSVYRYERERPMKHVVGVRWLWIGDYSIHEKNSLALSTLVESSRRKSLLKELDALLVSANAAPPSADAQPKARRPYAITDAAKDLFAGEGWLEHQLTLLRRKKNLILRGPPGVGKTFVAKRLAFLLMGEIADERVELVQFHPSYTYEQFVRGYRPEPKGGFAIENGPLYRMAEKAKGDDPRTPYVLVIDEINRGHLGKILGEAMMLIEADKRSEDWSVRLAYPDPQARTADGEEERFFLPPNLYVIGTMNTADRSLAVVDYALRRRFAFVDVKPAFSEPAFKAHLEGMPPEIIEQIIQRIGRLNELISADLSLGDGFHIGHSYFCLDGKRPEDARAWFADILEHEVVPLIDEYWYDNKRSAQQAREVLGLS